MSSSSQISRRGVRAMLWAAAILFVLNFYMFVAARPGPVVVETQLAPIVHVQPKIMRCDRVPAPAVTPSTESKRLQDARRILARERERMRKRCIRFANPQVRVMLTTPSAG